MNKSIKAAAQVIRATNHPIRWAIIEACQAQPMTVGQIQQIVARMDKLGRTANGLQSQASQHLAILRGAGLVTTRRDGKFVYYTTNQGNMVSLIGLCSTIGDLRPMKSPDTVNPSNAVEHA